MNLKDYYNDCESKYESDKEHWNQRADECIEKALKGVVGDIKFSINQNISRNVKEVICGKRRVIIEYKVKNPYNNRFPSFRSNYNDSSTWWQIDVNNEAEATYCRDRLKSKLEEEGLEVSVDKYGYGLLSFTRIKHYSIYCKFVP